MAWIERWRRWRGLAGSGLGRAWEQLLCGLANTRRRLLRRRMADYAVITLDHAISEHAPDVPWWYAYLPGVKLPLSLQYLRDALERIAGDPDIKGVVFLLKGPALTLAQAQSLALLFERFRARDRQLRAIGASAKQLIVHLEEAGAAAYVVACAADRVTMTPLTTWDVVGLRVAPTYWRETLARAGIEFEAIKVAPWKTAMDPLIRSDMSDAEREQTNWLLDSLCEDIVAAIAQGRKLPGEQVSALINRAPLTADAALAAGLVDHIVYEDQLAALLGTAQQPARLKPYASLRSLLLRRPRRRPSRRVGVLSLQGAIVVGESRNFPVPLPVFGQRLMGSNTVEQQIRAARKNPRLAAVVVYVDSGGGSALASDLIWRELRLLDQEKPVVVYMGDVAASGGYYIATPGRKIIAQRATLTGSIGVVLVKGVTAGLRDKIGANREVVRRGENAGLFTDDQPWTETQRRTLEESVFHIYNRFKQVVAEGRSLPYEELDAICNGRVWTGKQALDHGLVDELGDFQAALEWACRLAGLPTDSPPTETISPPRTRLLAEPAQAAVWGRRAWDAMAELASGLLQGDWPRLLGHDRFWLIAPGLPRLQ
ncbi:MAG TPA: signal peptide peptidase SppA [Caldilineaceae bacterium]|nr:signal peptide peptidase SppA [Caldilineaceae bacterium]